MRRLILALTICQLGLLPAAAQQQFGPFVVDPEIPGAIILNGMIDLRSALEFKRAVAAYPNAEIVVLNSPGGSVQTGLLIAEEIYERGLSTFVPDRFACESACSWIFFAGNGRLVEGKLGVHQMSGDVQDNATTQLNVSDVIEALNKYGTPTEVLAAMLRTPASSMYYFSPEEIERLGFNRTSKFEDNQHPTQPAALPVPDLASQARQFVESLISAHGATSAEALAAVSQSYADQISYFGKTMPLGDVLLDKQSYFQRFPARTYQIQPESVSATCSSNLCEVRGLYRWIVTGPKRTASGRANFTYMIDMTGRATVLAEGGAVLPN